MSGYRSKVSEIFKRRQPPVFAEVKPSFGQKSRDQLIPLVCRQTALSRWVHPDHLKSIEEIREIQGDLNFEFYDDHQVNDYMRHHWKSEPIYDVFTRARIGQIRADIFRYCITFQLGGYYLDLSKGCYSPLTSMHPAEAGGIIAFERNQEILFPDSETAGKISNPFNVVLQWAFGFRPQHPLLRKVIDRICEIEPYFRDVTFDSPKWAVLTLTGPGVFTSSYRGYLKETKKTDIVEAGVDFNGSGMFRIPGSVKSIKKQDHYSELVNDEIISSKANQLES